MAKKKEREWSDLVVRIVNEFLMTLLEFLKSSLVSLPKIMKYFSKRLIKKYALLLVFGIVGLFLLSLSAVELLSGILPLWGAYAVVGGVLLCVGFIQFMMD